MYFYHYKDYTTFHKTWYHSREPSINKQLRLAWSISVTKVILCFIKHGITLGVKYLCAAETCMVHFSYEGYTTFHKTWYHSGEPNISEQLRLAWSI